MTHASVFAALHHAGHPFVLPNAWDVGSALLLQDAGFPAIGTTSMGVTAAAGLPDGAGLGRELTVALARQLVRRLSVPLTVDLENGYSDDAAAVSALAAELAGLGVAGINLEDGRPDGRLRPIDEQAALVRAVSRAAPGLFVNARTDMYWLRAGPPGERLAATTRRLLAYREAGACGVFVPGLSDPADIATVVEVVRLPLNVLWHPDADLLALAAAGAARVSTGSALYRHALAAALQVAGAAREGEPPATAGVDYGRMQRLLRAAAPVDRAGGGR